MPPENDDEMMTQDERDFMAAYQEQEGGQQGGPAVKTSAEAEGGAQPAAADESGSTPASSGDQPAAGAEASGAGEGGGAGGEMPAAADGGDAADAPTDPKDVQRQKSWEGRLKQRERDLAEREAKLKEAEAKMNKDPQAAEEALEQVAEAAEAKGNEQMAEAAEAAAEAVEEGKISAADALARLKEDWGGEFIDMITAVVRDIARQEADLVSDGKVKEGIGSLEKRTMDGFRSIGERHMLLHKEKIDDAVPGYEQMVGTEAFEAFKAKYPDGDKIAEGGTARQIIKMLKAFQATQGEENNEADGTSQAGKDQIDRDAGGANQPVAQAQPSEAAIDAAAGVRSGGAVRVPEAPTESADYAGAWVQA